MFRITQLLILSIALACASFAAEKKDRAMPEHEDIEASKEEKVFNKESPSYKPEISEGEARISEGEARISGKKDKYTTKTGMMPILDAGGELKAKVFFVYYQAESKDSELRPVTFCFNGGPGSSAV